METKEYPCGDLAVPEPNPALCKWCFHFHCELNTNFASRPAGSMLERYANAVRAKEAKDDEVF